MTSNLIRIFSERSECFCHIFWDFTERTFDKISEVNCCTHPYGNANLRNTHWRLFWSTVKEIFGLTQEHQQEDPQEIQSHLVKTRHMEKKTHQRNNQIIVSCNKPQPGRNYLLKVQVSSTKYGSNGNTQYTSNNLTIIYVHPTKKTHQRNKQASFVRLQ